MCFKIRFKKTGEPHQFCLVKPFHIHFVLLHFSRNYWIWSRTAYLVLFPAAFLRPPVQRTDPVWSWSQHWGCSPSVGFSPAWLTVLTSTPPCLFHSLCTCVAPSSVRNQTKADKINDNRPLMRLEHPYLYTSLVFIQSHLTLALQISDLLLLQLHVHAELLALRLQLSDTTSKRICGLHSVAQTRTNICKD